MQQETSREVLSRTGFQVWKNKRLSEMTDAECDTALRAVERLTGTIYLRRVA